MAHRRKGPLTGISFFLPSGDPGEVWANRIVAGEYETEMLSALAEITKESGVFYDIGARIAFSPAHGRGWAAKLYTLLSLFR